MFRNANWPNVRAALYTLVTGFVAVLGGLGLVAPERVDGVTQAATAAAGLIVTLLALANVGKGNGEEAPAPQVAEGGAPAAFPLDVSVIAAEASRMAPAAQDLATAVQAEAARWQGQAQSAVSSLQDQGVQLGQGVQEFIGRHRAL